MAVNSQKNSTITSSRRREVQKTGKSSRNYSVIHYCNALVHAIWIIHGKCHSDSTYGSNGFQTEPIWMPYGFAIEVITNFSGNIGEKMQKIENVIFSEKLQPYW